MKPQFTVGMNYGETVGPAMKINDQAEADEYFDALVEFSMSQSNQPRAVAEMVERNNLGYYAGYFDNETRERVERLFRCAHPIFGPIRPSSTKTEFEVIMDAWKKGKE